MRRARLLLLVVILLVPAVIAAVVLFRVQKTLNRAVITARDQQHLRFTLEPLDPAHLLAANPGFVAIATPDAFTCAAFFHGELYLAGPTGLAIAGPDGAIRRRLRSGIELPTAPLTALAVARLRGASSPELLIATQGQGLILLTEQGTTRQLLADDPDSRDLTALLPLATGDLLLGTRRHGLLVYSGQTLEQVPVPVAGLDATRLEITALAPDPTGFWAGTRNTGLLHLHGGAMEHIDVASGLPDPEVDALTVTATRAYAGTPLGVAEFDLSASSTRPLRTLAANTFAHALAVDGKELLVGTVDQGIETVPLLPKLRAIGFPAPDTGGSVQQFFATKDDPTIYALAQGSVLHRAGSHWTSVLTPSATQTNLTDGNISALAFAPDGRLWVGFFDRGLDILSPDLTRPTHLEDDRLFCINRLVLDPRRGTMAVATANGLVLFDAQGHPRQTLTRRDGLIADHINDVAFTPQGMAIATPAGITFVDATATQSLYAFQGLVNNHVYTLAARGRQLLAGTLGGISMLDSADEAVGTNLTVTNSRLGHNWITAVVPASDGGWEIGTYGAGVLHMSPRGDFIPMQIPGKPDLIINPNAMLATNDAIYTGTLGRGLWVYRRASGNWTQVSNGLPSENVTALAERGGELYVGTDAGLVRIAEAALNRSAQ